jgi:hypothetical protein
MEHGAWSIGHGNMLKEEEKSQITNDAPCHHSDPHTPCAEQSRSIAESERQFFNHRRRIMRGASFLQRFHCSAVALAPSLLRTLVPSHPRTFDPSYSHIPFSQTTCSILGKTIRFAYADPEMEDLFRPMFRQFEVKSMEHGLWSMEHGSENKAPVPGLDESLYSSIPNRKSEESLRRSEIFVEKCHPTATEPPIEILRPEQNRIPGDQDNMNEREVEVKREDEGGSQIDFFLADGNYAFRVNDHEIHYFESNDIEHFQGAVLMELLNLLYGKTRVDWMAVFHASAVSDGKEALLFVAASGSGKSTLAALMVAHGYQLLSDDFLPVALEIPELYPLPAAISVKKNAIPFLKNYFPSLSEQEEETAENTNREVFLPLPEDGFASSPAKAKAIVFVQYDPAVDFRLTLESNLTSMNILLKQSWIPDHPAAAERFLSWYFSLPVYSLVYSDSKRAVSGMMELIL